MEEKDESHYSVVAAVLEYSFGASCLYFDPSVVHDFADAGDVACAEEVAVLALSGEQGGAYAVSPIVYAIAHAQTEIGALQELSLPRLARPDRWLLICPSASQVY